MSARRYILNLIRDVDAVSSATCVVIKSPEPVEAQPVLACGGAVTDEYAERERVIPSSGIAVDICWLTLETPSTEAMKLSLP